MKFAELAAYTDRKGWRTSQTCLAMGLLRRREAGMPDPTNKKLVRDCEATLTALAAEMKAYP